MASELHRQAEVGLRNARNVEMWRGRMAEYKYSQSRGYDSYFACDMRTVDARFNWYRTQQRIALAKRRLQGR